MIIIADDHFRFTFGPPLIGSLLAIAGGFAFAVFTVAIDKLDRDNPTRQRRLFFLGIVFLASYAVLVTVAYLSTDRPPLDPACLWILGLNGFRVALVYALYQSAVDKIGGVLTSLVVALEVPLTMLFDAMLLDRAPSARLVIGSIAVLAGAVVLASETMHRTDAPKNA